MAGIKGSGGPVPKRKSQLRRQNVTEPVTTAVSDGAVRGYELPGEHSEQAARFWMALRTSGQAQFYEASDWAMAELILIAIDAFVARPSAMMLASLNSALSNLLVTEGDRRRARLELERQPVVEPDADSDVAELDEYRQRLAG